MFMNSSLCSGLTIEERRRRQTVSYIVFFTKCAA